MGKLTATAVKNAKPGEKPRKLSDGHGLYLLVQPDGSKYWRYNYRMDGKHKTLALGVYPDVTLAEARENHNEARKAQRKGVDPAQLKRVEKLTRKQAAAESFEAIGREWFERHMENMSESHRTRTERIFEKDLYPHLGPLPIADIKAPEILTVLRRIEARSVDIAHRAKQAAGQVFRYAVSTGRAERDSTADLRGALKSKHKVHYAALTKPEDVGALLVAMDDYGGGAVVRTALQINALTFQRPGLVRAMEWKHINWEEALWDVPAKSMQKTAKAGQAGRPHVVPLSRQAIAHLQELHRLTGRRRFVFPSPRGASRCLSDNGMRTALRTMGYTKEQMTPHGFRAMARTLLDEVLGFRVDVIEHQLAHTVRDPLGRAYNRTTHLADRIAMMQRWADYLDELRAAEKASNVVQLSPKAWESG
jgi:integrase